MDVVIDRVVREVVFALGLLGLCVTLVAVASSGVRALPGFPLSVLLIWVGAAVKACSDAASRGVVPCCRAGR